jgi:hypothetical protein
MGPDDNGCGPCRTGSCVRHNQMRAAGVVIVGEGKRSDDILRCARSGNPCGTDTVQIGHHCSCSSCRHWLAAFRQGLEAAERIAQQQADTWRTHGDTLQIGTPQKRKANIGEDTALVIVASIRAFRER